MYSVLIEPNNHNIEEIDLGLTIYLVKDINYHKTVSNKIISFIQSLVEWFFGVWNVNKKKVNLDPIQNLILLRIL